MLDDTDPEQRVLGLTLGYRLLDAMSYARKKHIPVINLSAYCQTVPEDTPEENGSH